jgi:hypothetical protein
VAEPAAPPLGPAQRPASKPAAAKRKTVQIPADAFAPVIGLAFSMAARGRGPHWQATPDEIAALSVAIADIAVYIPLPEKELGIGIAINNLAVTGAMIFGPRIQIDAELRAQAAQASAVAQAEAVVRQAAVPEEGPRQW